MRLRLLSLLGGLGLLVAAAPYAAEKPEPAQSDAEAQFHVMAGEMAAGRQQPAIAAREFLAALETVDDPDLARRATLLAIGARDEGLALQGAQRWLALEPNAMEPREVIARIALARGDLATTAAQAQAIIEGHAGGIEDGFGIVAAILGQTDPALADGALTVIEQLAARYPKNAGGPHAIAIVALHFKRLTLADEASKRAMALAPKSRDEKLLRIGVLVKLDRFDEAGAMIETLAKKDPQADELRLAFAKLLLEGDQRDRARTQLQKVLQRTPNQPDAMFALGVMSGNDRDYATADKLLQPLLEGPRGDEAAFQLGRFAEVRRDFPTALDYYDRVDRGPRAFDAAIRQAAVLAEMGKVDEARSALQDLRDDYPQFAPRFLLAEIELLLNRNRHEEALTLLNEGLQSEPADTDLLYSRSLVYERIGKIDAAEKDLRAVLATEPDNARSLNALGYMLAVHTKRLDEAHQLVGRALALDPDDAAILDSMGWVEFKRGNLPAATDLLRRAFSDFPDPEVAAHLGEVLWSAGRKDEARSIWDRALKESPDHPVLRETVQRLTR